MQAEPLPPLPDSSDFSSLRRGDTSDTALITAAIDSLNAGGSYHELDFGDGFCVKGEYDLRRYLPHYALPQDLSGKTVLDVGTASGFFAFECARRGAGSITAIDIWEVTPIQRLSGCLRSNIHYMQKDIYALDASFGTFDLVICGSLLLHLPDQLGAIRALRSVCGNRLVISTACSTDSKTETRPIFEFLGQQASTGDYYHYWNSSAAGLRQMLHVAGFSQVIHEAHFVLRSEPGRSNFAVPHVALTAIL